VSGAITAATVGSRQQWLPALYAVYPYQACVLATSLSQPVNGFVNSEVWPAEPPSQIGNRERLTVGDRRGNGGQVLQG